MDIKSRLLLALLAGLVACEASPPPTMQTGPSAEVSYDGLVRVDNSRMEYAWIRPGINLSSYDTMMLVGAGIEYRSVREANRLRLSSSTEFPLDEGQRARIEESVREVFVEELAKIEIFEIVTEPGPNTLALTGAFIDVTSYVPPQRAGRTDYYLSQLGAATLVLELTDSMSGQKLARAVGRRGIDVQTPGRSNTVSNRFELRRELSRWASLIRDGLVAMVETPIQPAGD